MNILRIKETCIYVTDLVRTRDFYSGTLGLPLISLVEGRHVFFKAGESVLLCFIADETMKKTELPQHGASGIIHFAFEVSAGGYESTLKKIEKEGVVILHKHSWKGGLSSFYFHDPDGNLVEIIEEGLWQ